MNPWDAAYRAAHVPWASETIDADLGAALATHAPPPGRLLDLGCGLGQIARHAARSGYRVVATDSSDVALAAARARAGADDIVWVRDDVCGSALHGTFDVIVDRATLHVLPAQRASAWAATIVRLLAPGGVAIIKCHRDGIAGATTSWSEERLAQLLPELAIIETRAAELPGLVDATPVPSLLIVAQRAK
jgi:SAM-dependent methyltransferase